MSINNAKSDSKSNKYTECCWIPSQQPNKLRIASYIQGVPKVAQRYNGNWMLFDSSLLREFWDTL